MILCDLEEAPVRAEIGAAVADVADEESRTRDHGRDERGAHPSPRRIRLHAPLPGPSYGVVRGHHRPVERAARILLTRVVRREERLDRDAARDLAARMPAH